MSPAPRTVVPSEGACRKCGATLPPEPPFAGAPASKCPACGSPADGVDRTLEFTPAESAPGTLFVKGALQFDAASGPTPAAGSAPPSAPSSAPAPVTRPFVPLEPSKGTLVVPAAARTQRRPERPARQKLSGAFEALYEVKEVLGEGGMGIVYRAVQRSSGCEVAVKFTLADDPGLRERFLSEGRIMAHLRHPGIVQVFESGEEGGQLFIALEFVQGQSLAERLRKQKGGLPVLEALQLGQQLCSALSHAHRQGVLHRDLKPDNVLLCADGTPKIADFGLGRTLGAGRLTQAGTILGTPGYMAPEILLGEEASIASDVFSLGVVLYELATGRQPFPARDLGTYLKALKNGAPLAPTEVRGELPSGLDTVLLRCLDAEPASRYPDAEEVGAELARLAKNLPPGAKGAPAASRRMTSTAAIPVEARLRGGREALLRRAALPALAALVAVGAVLGLVSWLHAPPAVAPSGGVAVGRPQPGRPPPGRLASEPAGPVGGGAQTTSAVGTGVAAAHPAVTTPEPATAVANRALASTGPSTRPALPHGLTALGVGPLGLEVYRNEKDGSVLIRLPAGPFTMGSESGGADEKPIIRVELSSYLIGKTEVSNWQFEKFVRETDYRTTAERRGDARTWRHPDGAGSAWWGPDHPVVLVSWEDASAYCEWAFLRLPTEAQWERAARGGDGLRYPWGAQPPEARRPPAANLADLSAARVQPSLTVIAGYDDRFARTSPVGAFPGGASPAGTLDQLGNVWEWCLDWYEEKAYQAQAASRAVRDPAGPAEGEQKSMRGGSWRSVVPVATASTRYWNRPQSRADDVGFRTARSWP